MDSCVDSCLSECCGFLLCSLIVVILRVSTVLVLGLVCKPMIMEMILAGEVSNHCIGILAGEVSNHCIGIRAGEVSNHCIRVLAGEVSKVSEY